MIAALRAGGLRVRGLLGRLSMYRLILGALGLLAAVALVLSLFELVVPTAIELLATAVVLIAVGCGVDVAAQLVRQRPVRLESTLITALILLFVLRPSVEPAGLLGVALAAAAAALSKHLIAWRGRHILNPAAVGATVVTVVGALLPDAGLSLSAWWVGSPVLAPAVILTGLAVLLRTEKVRLAALFVVVATAVYTVRTVVQLVQFDLAVDLGSVLSSGLLSGPFLFLGAFMLTEPLTLPPRRRQQYLVAVVVAVLAGWSPLIGGISLGQERALLIGNLVAFALAIGSRPGAALRLLGRSAPTPTSHEVVLESARPISFQPGQYLELEVPHRRPDGRGTRREFSIVSAPEELPTVRVSYRDGTSTYKRALTSLEGGAPLRVTGVWGDFTLPRDEGAPLLWVAAGIGITPFVSQLRHLELTDRARDIVLVYVVSTGEELAYRDLLARTGIRVLVWSRDPIEGTPDGWQTETGRLDAAGLAGAVRDIGSRHAYVSGPPALIAGLSPALRSARSVTTDAFAGY
ncbi:FAD-dependent oxidoreductase [Microbacterium marinilacus]|uniref:FAD-binding FR-type domain-containing protein n=1 Tax=Microbacterium marinilacus TaxID=415209 RepID=A0ABP7BXC8_9MICO|nr:FAD-dependent oxidoreductase [Microbacterium marinilacus]